MKKELKKVKKHSIDMQNLATSKPKLILVALLGVIFILNIMSIFVCLIEAYDTQSIDSYMLSITLLSITGIVLITKKITNLIQEIRIKNQDRKEIAAYDKEFKKIYVDLHQSISMDVCKSEYIKNNSFLICETYKDKIHKNMEDLMSKKLSTATRNSLEGFIYKNTDISHEYESVLSFAETILSIYLNGIKANTISFDEISKFHHEKVCILLKN